MHEVGMRQQQPSATGTHVGAVFFLRFGGELVQGSAQVADVITRRYGLELFQLCAEPRFFFGDEVALGAAAVADRRPLVLLRFGPQPTAAAPLTSSRAALRAATCSC